MRVLITGGSGFLGINLVRHLLNSGIEDIAVLDLVPFGYPERGRVTELTGDIRDAGKVERAVKGADVVVHAAAALPLYKKRDIYSTDVDGTRNVVSAAWRNNVKRLIHISSTAVYGIPDHHPLREDDRLDGVGPYGKAKIASENICLEYRAKGLCVPIIRPKSFIGPERLGVFALLFDWAREGRNFPVIGRGDNRYQLLDVEDLCEAVRLAMVLKAETVNDTFNIGARVFTTMREDFQAVLDRAGRGGKIIGFPAMPVIAVLRILELFHLSPLYAWVYETAGRDSFVSIEKAERKLGFSPRYSNRDALVRNYDWYIQNMDKFQDIHGVSHRVPWKQGILKLVRKMF